MNLAMLKKFVLPLVAVLLVAAYAWQGVYTVLPDETGVVQRFGKVVNGNVPSGMHLNLLWPVSRVFRVNTSSLLAMSAGYKELDRVRGIPPQPEETEWLTRDINIVNLQIAFQYRVADPVAYLFSTEKPWYFIRRFAEAHMTRLVGRLGVDDVLTIGKQKLGKELHSAVQQELDNLKLGLEIGAVNILSVEPPSRVKPSFQDVVDARADKERMILEARSDANQVIPEARGKAQAILSEAQSQKQNRISEAQGLAERFLAMERQYRTDPLPGAFKERLYLQTVEEVLPRANRLLVDTQDGENPTKITLTE